jgi:predicted phosphodiesterase
MKYRRVVAISDIQAPYHHPKTIQFYREIKREFRPDLVVSMGDETDQRTLSRFVSDPEDPSAGDEYEEAMGFWAQMYRIFPTALAVHSNHGGRVFKRATEAGIPRQYLRTQHEWMKAPKGWRWAEYWEIDGIRYEHGERASGGLAGLRLLVIANMMHTVVGHMHESAGTTWVANDKKRFWGMNVGCMVDKKGAGLRYTKLNKYKPVLGCGVIIDGIPRFVPYS